MLLSPWSREKKGMQVSMLLSPWCQGKSNDSKLVFFVILIKRKEKNVSGYALNVRWYALNVRWYALVALVRRKVRNAVILIFVQVCILILFARKYIIKFIRTKHYNCVSSNSKNLENFQSSIV